MTNEEAIAHVERAKAVIAAEERRLTELYATLRDPADQANFVAGLILDLMKERLQAVELDTDCRQLIEERNELKAFIELTRD